jgi:carboxymethylenebutenolidase
MELDMAEAVAEIGAAGDFLNQGSQSDGSAPAVVGFCMGGRLALQAVLVEDGLATVVPFYGTPLTAEQAPGAKAPVLGLYGEEDTGIPVDDVRAMETALTEAGVENEIQIYPGAGHAFFNDTRESYNPDAASDAWTRTLEWLRRHQSA